MQEILKGLNENQYKAVVNIEGPCLVIAGAGSGKTKVLTHKIAYILEQGARPWDIIAITFTNKAANEMKERITNLVGDTARDIWMGTFHSICVRILRKNIERLGFSSSFIIFDSADQKSVVKACLKELGIDDKAFTEKSIVNEISNAKNEMLEPAEYLAKAVGDFRKEKIATIYSLYQKKLRDNNAIDFDDIINFTIKIMQQNEDVLEYYACKFKYVLVDEYQDTNKAQFTLVKMLASIHKNITVVGDNDQGIYSFRGADISNILNFEKDFSGSKIIKLEQNYRCSGNILKAANAVIKNNPVKYKKELWTDNEEGNKPTVFRANNEYEESTYVVNQIQKLKTEHGYSNLDFAILYRMNTQSRVVEDILRRENMPYKIVGGLKFYERKEIKDIISYLRLIQNEVDNVSLKRIINEPKRGIGKTSMDKIEEISNQTGMPMYKILKDAEQFGLNRVFLNSREFINLIEALKERKDNMKVSEIITILLEKSGYIKALKDEKTLEADNRIDNLEEFLNVAMEFEKESADNTLSEFLEGITLSSDLDNLEETEDTVTLMTLHSAKGLEFPIVFLVGLEEGIFPGHQSIAEPSELEEERRLCYVGITRAKKHLYMTCSKQRTIFGSTSYNKMSRFLEEIPKDILDAEDIFINKNKTNILNRKNSIDIDIFKRKTSGTVEQFLSKAKPKVDFTQYRTGVTVYHKKFGEGVITCVEPEDDDLKVSINFERFGFKRLMAKYAALEVR